MASDSKPILLTDYDTEEETGALLGVSYKTMRNWRRDGIGPPVTFLGQKPYYFRASTQKWLRDQERVKTRGRRIAATAA